VKASLLGHERKKSAVIIPVTKTSLALVVVNEVEADAELPVAEAVVSTGFEASIPEYSLTPTPTLTLALTLTVIVLDPAAAVLIFVA
jgi:hypothetical protein